MLAIVVKYKVVTVVPLSTDMWNDNRISLGIDLTVVGYAAYYLVLRLKRWRER